MISTCSRPGIVRKNCSCTASGREEDIPLLMATQSALLDNAARYVKAGGRLYYSTCSVLPEENDTAAHNFLAAHKNFALLPTDSPLAHMNTRYGMQFLPHISMGAGFFLTAFEREG